MPKIESIRPGGTLSASFAEYPFADLLIGILRANLSGRLDVAVHPEPRNQIWFRDGVPIGVDLIDVPVSLPRLLVETGEISEPMALELSHSAETEGITELSIIDRSEILAPGRLRELEALRARAQLVRLFDIGAVEFVFNEGLDRPEQVRLTILQPLPIVYDGLRCTRDRAVIERVLEDHKGKSFILAATYPRGVDAFEWGTNVEVAIGEMEHEPHTLAELVELGLDRREASAAMAALLLADMLDVQEKVSKRGRPGVPTSQPKNPPLEGQAEKEASGLIIHYKTGAKSKPSSNPTNPTAPTPTEYEAIKARFGHYEGKNYYQILRVAPNTDASQIERAYRFLVRRPDGGESDDVASRALKGLYHEAFECLSEADRARRYRALVEWADKSANAVREREALEAEPKVDRGFRALGEGHLAEARALLEWAQRLDPLRGDIPLLLDLARYMDEAGAADPLGIATALVGEQQRRPDDERVKMAYAFCLVEENETTAARALIDTVEDRDHPMARRVQDKLQA